MNANRKKLIFFLVLPLAVGALAGFLTKNSMMVYKNLNQPPLSPPGWIFPIVWTILYLLMGLGSYLIAQSSSPKKKEALQIYGIQLALNFIWSIVFFNLQNYLLAFLILLVLWYFIIRMIRAFGSVNPTAALMQIPYLLWVTFAGYLNLAIVLLN
ncbi:TspO/MBR family protein [Lacrimispora xylanisolvens]|uniref:TspO/MBR family protein n=1 Tax=Lacrimispora xylanisolvens TaxID=384636 RepID=UPI002402D82E|nr:tryptophan-rich sensory protein [Paenibacillaceae bacterium]